ncbi:uncharacterized protein KQ657_002888 [Scheffersomyces spartinae]|uniref:t-SNARE coiled-coil homology domain-containing protein n=1 Tax=Scheffersomyces spartinae TaxID=45513 RepID=A0A9P7V5H2_9ASCO|nr:uncharacterized protein KQ657_002888 [Scheffersomyces spartinae]KAG7191752.1 hypothetical protein KQ657_002888 [Scheffersomyces spartinae]
MGDDPYTTRPSLRLEFIDEEEGLMGSRRHPRHPVSGSTRAGHRESIELKVHVPTIFEIANELNDLVLEIRRQTDTLNTMYKKLIIVGKQERKEVEGKIENTNYEILKRFESCYILVKKFSYLGNNWQKLSLDYGPSDLQILHNYQKTYASTIQELSLLFRNIQNNYIKFLKDDDDDDDDGGGNNFRLTSNVNLLLEEEESHKVSSSNHLDKYSKQLLQQVQAQPSQVVQQREREISKIAMGILEILTIFKEMESMIVDQGSLLDRIDYNLQNTLVDLKKADKELIKAQLYQKRTTKCKLIFLLTLIVLGLMIVVIVRPHHTVEYVDKPALEQPQPEPEPESEEPQSQPEKP